MSKHASRMVRAKLTITPESSDFTSGLDRILARQGRHQLRQVAHLDEKMRTENQRCLLAQAREAAERDQWLCPIEGDPESGRSGFMGMGLDSYLALLDWTGCQMVEGKKVNAP